MLVFALAVAEANAADATSRWWKGNTHTHTFWTDGNDYPEVIADWYKRQGYHFLGLSDHNGLQDTERWMDLAGRPYNIPDRPTHAEILHKYLERFGEDWVETREAGGKREVRLKRHDEYAPLLEEPGRFLLLPSEEISADPIHLNATNLRSAIEPVKDLGTTDLRRILREGADRVMAQRQSTGQPMFLTVNHPVPLVLKALADVDNARFFEIYNAGSNLQLRGLERAWDIALTQRAERAQPPLFGIATDDSHQYQLQGPGHQNPGGGWVMVRAANLAPGDLVRAMEAGDFYASSGVTLQSLERDDRGISLRIDAEPDVTYTTRFIGTRKGHLPPAQVAGSEEFRPYRGGAPVLLWRGDVGEVLAEVEGAEARYVFAGDELYVRAVIVSSRQKGGGLVPGTPETAWVQPVFARTNSDHHVAAGDERRRAIR